MNKDFQANLKLLCSFYKSISEVCRRLEINRAQFNRYLNGTTFPSTNTLRRFCDFFGVEVEEIKLPHQQFQRLVQVKPEPFNTPAAPTSDPALMYQQRVMQMGQKGLDKYLGYYFEYYLSMAYPGKILRTLVCLEKHAGKTYFQRTERIQKKGRRHVFHGKYKGMVQYLSDRIFMMDFETLTEYEITQTILFPSFKNRIDCLTGLRLGVSGSGERMPCCTRVVYEYLGQEVSFRKAFKLCGLYDLDSDEIESGIRQNIRNDIKEDEWHFRARF
ncbi:MAG: helix-turn-helix domain-containing protein [Marinomonas sp.]|uniref:helix-turn-helix domain-containing protein n=1 Tax=Marinomonas sp. PE14-40 TaxID=3060621 RepID=UPI003C329E38